MTSSFVALRSAVEQKLGRPAGLALLAITATQFHLPFYASRPLANVLALVPVGFALAAMLHGKHPRRTIALLTFATVPPGAILRYKSQSSPRLHGMLLCCTIVLISHKLASKLSVQYSRSELFLQMMRVDPCVTLSLQ